MVKNKILDYGDVVFLPGSRVGAVVTNAAISTQITRPDKDSADSRTIAKPTDRNGIEYSPWGDNNLYPQNVLEDIEKNSITLRAIEVRVAAHFGRGIIAYREKDDDTKEIVKDQEVVDFISENKINRIWYDNILALETFANSFPEMILNKARTRINRIHFLDTAFCRYSKMNDKFRIEKVFYNADWTKPGKAITIPMYDADKWVNKDKYKDKKFVYPCFYRSIGTTYYHKAVWHGVRTSGWLTIANKVPEMKKAIMENQMVIKYHIKIPDNYFTKRYTSPDYTPKQREEKRKQVLEDMNEFLTDVENSGKAFISYKFYNEQLDKEYPGWEIEAIDNKLKDDAYLPDSQAANSEILFSLGVDPALLGAGIPGGKLGAGSGSDKREAYWMLNANMGVYRTQSLDPLYFIRDFNKWDPKIKFDYAVVDTSQTQNEHPTKTKQRIDSNTTD